MRRQTAAFAKSASSGAAGTGCLILPNGMSRGGPAAWICSNETFGERGFGKGGAKQVKTPSALPDSSRPSEVTPLGAGNTPTRSCSRSPEVSRSCAPSTTRPARLRKTRSRPCQLDFQRASDSASSSRTIRTARPSEPVACSATEVAGLIPRTRAYPSCRTSLPERATRPVSARKANSAGTPVVWAKNTVRVRPSSAAQKGWAVAQASLTPLPKSRLNGQKKRLSAGTVTGTLGKVIGPEGSLTVNCTSFFGGSGFSRS